MGDPDCMNAPRNRSRESPPFATMCNPTEIAPALSPHLESRRNISQNEGTQQCVEHAAPLGETQAYIVTLEGSPPNAEMYFWIHLNARRSGATHAVSICDSVQGLWGPRTILEPEIANACILDFFAREEAERYAPLLQHWQHHTRAGAGART